MKKLLLATALTMLAMPALAKEYTIKEVSDPAGDKPYYFDPAELTIQPGDTVTFINAQEDTHDVMFVATPKSVDEMIMSPMLEKEGDKWSYTFNTPGTYGFHCHPHEGAGMKGTIIVGQASKPEDLKTVDHEAMEHNMGGGEHEHGSDHHAAAGIEATGKINSVDVASHKINITHDPIAALSWPKMTMEFPVGSDVDLSGFKAGDMVKFSMKSGENDQYSVTSLHKQ